MNSTAYLLEKANLAIARNSIPELVDPDNQGALRVSDSCETAQGTHERVCKEAWDREQSLRARIDSAEVIVNAARELYTAYAIVRKTEASEDDHFRLIVAHDDLHSDLKTHDAGLRSAASEQTEPTAHVHESKQP